VFLALAHGMKCFKKFTFHVVWELVSRFAPFFSAYWILTFVGMTA
jgi:hypothetical protein